MSLWETKIKSRQDSLVGVILVGVFISCTQLKINIKCFTAENMLLCCLSAFELKSPKTIVSKSEFFSL